MQNVSDETFDAVAVRKSLSKLSDFQSDTASPYRVLHQVQGDKQKKHFLQEIQPILFMIVSDLPLLTECCFPIFVQSIP